MVIRKIKIEYLGFYVVDNYAHISLRQLPFYVMMRQNTLAIVCVISANFRKAMLF